ncbi:hypothetical protein F4679DRAFT_178284 [Xylaria curta]|nr:hypothetical protein F4679DRAFT_178284 [Xylaria curta]
MILYTYILPMSCISALLLLYTSLCLCAYLYSIHTKGRSRFHHGSKQTTTIFRYTLASITPPAEEKESKSKTEKRNCSQKIRTKFLGSPADSIYFAREKPVNRVLLVSHVSATKSKGIIALKKQLYRMPSGNAFLDQERYITERQPSVISGPSYVTSRTGMGCRSRGGYISL